MQAIINKKRYNTETADLVAEYDSGGGRNDFHHFEESLYITKNGNWFIKYWGGDRPLVIDRLLVKTAGVGTLALRL